MKLPGRDLVAEGLADLADAERRLLPRGGEDVAEVHEDALGRFGPQVVQAFLAGHRAEVGLEQAGEFLRLGPFAAGAAVGAGDVLEAVLGGTALLLLVLFLEVVRAVALVAGQALHQRVGEDVDVAGRFPDLAGQDDGGIQADDVFAAADHGLPPLALDVFLQLGAEGPVVPGRTGATIDLTGLENESPALGEGNDLVEDGFCCHGNSNFYRAAGCGPRLSGPGITGWLPDGAMRSKANEQGAESCVSNSSLPAALPLRARPAARAGWPGRWRPRVSRVPSTVGSATTVPGAGNHQVQSEGAQQLARRSCPRPVTSTPRLRTSRAPTPMKTQPMGPPR